MSLNKVLAALAVGAWLTVLVLSLVPVDGANIGAGLFVALGIALTAALFVRLIVVRITDKSWPQR